MASVTLVVFLCLPSKCANYLLTVSTKNIDRLLTLVAGCSGSVVFVTSGSFVSYIHISLVAMENLDTSDILRMLKDPVYDSGSQGDFVDSDLEPDFEDSADADNYNSTSFLAFKIISQSYCIIILNSSRQRRD